MKCHTHPVSELLIAVTKIKSALKGRLFHDIEDAKKYDDGAVSYSTTGFAKMFQKWQHRWAKCIDAQG
jgi:hypothetical protein